MAMLVGRLGVRICGGGGGRVGGGGGGEKGGGGGGGGGGGWGRVRCGRYMDVPRL